MTDSDLDALLARIAAADAMLEAPARVERAVTAAYRETLVPAAIRPARSWLWAGLAATAVIAALIGMLRRPVAVEPAAASEEEAFLPLGDDDGDGEALADLEAVHVMRVEMPRTALAGFGYSGTGLPTEAGSRVRADLLVGNDGIARGIRFVP
jgi:hypothetical protein